MMKPFLDWLNDEPLSQAPTAEPKAEVKSSDLDLVMTTKVGETYSALVFRNATFDVGPVGELDVYEDNELSVSVASGYWISVGYYDRILAAQTYAKEKLVA